MLFAHMGFVTLGMFLFTRLTPSSGYAADVLPGLLVLGVALGCIFAPAFSTATLGVEGSEAGVASAMVNTAQQIGGSCFLDETLCFVSLRRWRRFARRAQAREQGA